MNQMQRGGNDEAPQGTIMASLNETQFENLWGMRLVIWELRGDKV